MTLASIKFILAMIVLASALTGGLWPFIKKAHELSKGMIDELDFPAGESLASGIFLGAGLLHMLPDATKIFNQAGYHYPFAFLIAGLSFLLLLLLEHILSALKHKTHSFLSSIALLTLFMLSLHAFLEGAALGLSTGLASTLIIFIAIIAHKSATSFALSINLNRSPLRLSSRIIAFGFFSLMTPLGIFSATWILNTDQHNVLLMPIFSSLAAGTFLYIGTLHGLARANLIRYCCNLKEFVLMLMGFITMALVALLT